MDADVVVVGGGAVGLATALAAARRGHSVTVLEKEAAPGRHQSSRNSGVIHVGYNLKPGSLKARFCAEGGRRMRAFCAEHGVAVDENGILVVAAQEEQRAVLDELLRRSGANGVPARIVDGAGLQAIEPAARGVAALHAPTGASVDAVGFVTALAAAAADVGVTIQHEVRVAHIDEDAGQVVVGARRGRRGLAVRARVVVNAAGLHADRVARALAKDLRIIPFRGYYAELKPARRALLRGHVYGAPDLAFPFLGVHLSRRTDGRVIVGPGAMLALGREAYRFWSLNVRDAAETFAWPGFYRLLKRPAFRALVRREVAKSLRLGAIAAEAARLVPGLRGRDLARSFAGNRAQVVDRAGNLVEDVVVRSTGRAIHVLNAVSPGLTSSLAFGEHLADLAAQRL